LQKSRYTPLEVGYQRELLAHNEKFLRGQVTGFSNEVNKESIRMREKKRIGFIFLMVFLAIFTIGGMSVCVKASEDKRVPKVGPVKMNPHPATLEGKTVLLRWNGKYNGDKYLSRVGELMIQQVKNVKIIKMWEIDKSTAAISKNAEMSEQVAASIGKLKPDLVIAAQAD
jgi:hypothetical protein